MADAVEVGTTLLRVELFEDRASVLRSVDVPKTAGRHRLSIGPLTPLVRTAGIAVLPDAGMVVEDVTVRRTIRARTEADDARAAELHAQVEELESELARAIGSRGRAIETAERVNAAANAARAWTKRALLEEEDLATWLSSVHTLEARRVDADIAAIEARHNVERLELERDRLALQRDAARQGSSVLDGFVEITLLVQQPGDLRIRYTVPCGVWRPVHRATLANDVLRWEVGAMAWNATGEDWTDVELVCSTARPGDRAEAPTLSDDVLYVQRREQQIVVEARDEVVHVARDGDTREVDEVPGVDDGGEPRTFTAPRPVSLPSNGRPVHVALESWESPATTSWLCHPEQSSLVVRRSEQHNAGTRPLLAGPVELFTGNGAVGRGQVGLVPPDEPFALGWGSHDGLRVTRRRDHTEERSRLTGYQTHAFEVTLKVVNLGDDGVTLTLKERVPVSELKEVKVGAPKAEPALSTGPDDDGFVTWELTLQARERLDLELHYTIEAPSSVQLPF